jgi:hypothetical protein
MPAEAIYRPNYENSWALIIGINEYTRTSPLRYACNDANAVADVLKSNFDFSEPNITLLTDGAATRDAIISAFNEFTTKKINLDDRILFFFAGHGHTATGKRGEIGFLVPVNGTPDDLATLITWGQLTQKSELIPAKHLLFVMDACYGGLAVTRYVPPGSMRFLKDMLQRYSRQVITAGKADEVVADAGGPRPEHSVFTGHLLNALEREASTRKGTLTANGVMAYVYDRVATDYQSQQTPHYGYIDGDGDFIFDTSALKEIHEEASKGEDVLTEVPPMSHVQHMNQTTKSMVDLIKEYLSDSKYKIKLDDLVVDEVRRVLYKTGNDSFPVEANVTPKKFAERLREYERILVDLQTMVTLISKWGSEHYRGIIERIFARLGDIDIGGGGNTVWLGLRWYPVQLLMYSGGIAALEARNYNNLATVLTTKVMTRHTGDPTKEIIVPAVRAILNVQRMKIFKTLPGHERHYVPRSEYLFRVLQPILEDLLFLGNGYEILFDKFEVFFALVYADLTFEGHRLRIWGPPGRFGWKYGSHENAFTNIVIEAARMKDDWPPLKSGLFRSSYDHFKEISEGYEELLRGLGWS